MNNASYKIALCQLLALLCDKMLMVAISWHIVSTSGNDFLSTYLAISLTPYILGVFIAPTLIRKFGAINIVMYSDAFRCLLYAATMLAVFYDTRFISNTMLVILSVTTNMAASLFSPAALSLPYILVKEDYLQKFLSILEMNIAFSALIGAPLGIIAYNYLGLNGLFLFSACIYGITTVIQKTIRLEKNFFEESNPDTAQKAIYSLNGFIKKYRLAFKIIILYAVSSLLFAPLMLYIPAYTIDVYQTNSFGLSALEVSLALGSIAGGLFLVIYTLESFAPWKVICASNFIGSVFYLGFALNTNLITAGFLLFAMGFCTMVETVFIFKIVQTVVSVVDIPFLMSLTSFMTFTAAPLGIYLASAIANISSIHSSASLFGLLGVFLSVGFFYVFREFKVNFSLGS